MYGECGKTGRITRSFLRPAHIVAERDIFFITLSLIVTAAMAEEERRGKMTPSSDSTHVNLVDKKCVSTEWFTPPEILAPVRKLLGDPIPLDPCTTANNPTKAALFYTKDTDGLSKTWNSPAYVNPPYGREMYTWIEKVVKEAAKGLPLILILAASSRWDQAKWQYLYSPELTTFIMPWGRVKFLDSSGVKCKSPPYPSVLYAYNIDPIQVYRAFEHMATVVRQEAL